MTKFRIEQTGITKRVFLDDDDISTAVREVDINFDARNPTEITLHLRVDQVEIASLGERDVTVLVNIPSDVEEVLTYLGWIKPNEARTTYRIVNQDQEGTGA